MKILSIQNSNPAFNGTITVRNSKTNLIRYHYSNLLDDKKASESLSKYVFPKAAGDKKNGLIEYLEVMLGASKDEAIEKALAGVKAGEINSINAKCVANKRDVFSKVVLDDTVIMHSADIRYDHI